MVKTLEQALEIIQSMRPVMSTETMAREWLKEVAPTIEIVQNLDGTGPAMGWKRGKHDYQYYLLGDTWESAADYVAANKKVMLSQQK